MSAWNDEPRRRDPDPKRDVFRGDRGSRGDRGDQGISGSRGEMGEEVGRREKGELRESRGDRGDRDSRVPGERRYPKPASPRRERLDIYATVFALGLALFLLLGYAMRPFIGGDGVPGKVARVAGDASVDNGRAVARELISDGAANFLWTAHWLAVAALLVVVLCGAGLARNFLLGDFFTLGSYRWVAAMCWTLIFYMFVPGFVGMLGGNMVLRDLGLHWVTIPAIDTNDFIVMYVLVMTLSLVGVAIRRASVLERDTEGLV